MGALKLATSGPNKGGERIRIETYLTRLGEDGQGGDRRGRGRKSEAKGIDKNDGATQFGSRAYFERSPNHLPNSSHLFFADPIIRSRRPLYYSLDSFVNYSKMPCRVVRLSTRGRSLLELMQRSSEPRLTCPLARFLISYWRNQVNQALPPSIYP
jgi:hypothetical protein